MGKRGPKPKPTALKKIQGTYQPSREAPNAPDPEPGIPEIPEGWAEESNWGEEAVREYYRITPTLKDLGLITKVDRAAILQYCDSWGRWCLWRKMASMGVNGAEANMNRAFDDLRKSLTLFGLSPADRTRVTSLAGAAQTRNPFEEFKVG